MSGKRYPDEFKIEAIEQVIDRGYKVGSFGKKAPASQLGPSKWNNQAIFTV